jgi:hypothetical protein
MQVPPLAVHTLQELHESGELAVFDRLNHQMKVVWHQAIGQELDGNAVDRPSGTRNERPIVKGVVEENLSTRAAVQDMKWYAGGTSTISIGHACSHSNFLPRKKTWGVFFY